MKEKHLWLVLDLGSVKCGYIVCSEEGKIIEHGIVYRRNRKSIHKVGSRRFMVELDDVDGFIKSLIKKYRVDKVIMGKRKENNILLNDSFNVEEVDESYSTEEAVRLYWLENRPRGIKDFVMKLFNVVPGDYDDYSAMVIFKRYLKLRKGER